MHTHTHTAPGHVLRLPVLRVDIYMASSHRPRVRPASSAECILIEFIGLAFCVISDVRPVGSRGPSIMARRQCIRLAPLAANIARGAPVNCFKQALPR